jgi:hypothetical protein
MLGRCTRQTQSTRLPGGPRGSGRAAGIAIYHPPRMCGAWSKGLGGWDGSVGLFAWLSRRCCCCCWGLVSGACLVWGEKCAFLSIFFGCWRLTWPPPPPLRRHALKAPDCARREEGTRVATVDPTCCCCCRRRFFALRLLLPCSRGQMEDQPPSASTKAPQSWHLGKAAVHIVIGEIENVVAAMRLNSRWGSGPRLVPLPPSPQ